MKQEDKQIKFCLISRENQGFLTYTLTPDKKWASGGNIGSK